MFFYFNFVFNQQCCFLFFFFSVQAINIVIIIFFQTIWFGTNHQKILKWMKLYSETVCNCVLYVLITKRRLFINSLACLTKERGGGISSLNNHEKNSPSKFIALFCCHLSVLKSKYYYRTSFIDQRYLFILDKMENWQYNRNFTSKNEKTSLCIFFLRMKVILVYPFHW